MRGDLRVGTAHGGPSPITESTDMGDSATGTGAPLEAGGFEEQPIGPAMAGKKSAKSGGTQTHNSAETDDITGGMPQAGAAGTREDAEAGETAAEKSDQVDQDAASKAAEYITRTILGDREPGKVDPLHPAGSTRENDRKKESAERSPAMAADEIEL